MTKRKREEEQEEQEQEQEEGHPLEPCLAELEVGLFRALKEAKGFERQRQSRRLQDRSTPPHKKARIEKEILVLKSLDLHQAAHAHLTSALLRLNVISESAEKLPQQWREVVPKPELEEDERAALHNVTSSLSNQPKVRGAIDKAVAGVCDALGIEVPQKKGKGKKDTTKGMDKKPPTNNVLNQPIMGGIPEPEDQNDKDGDEEWQGFSDTHKHQDLNQDGPLEQDSDHLAPEEQALGKFERRLANPSRSKGKQDSQEHDTIEEEPDSDTLEAEEEALTRYEEMLADPESTDGEGDDDFMMLAEKYRGKETVNYDDISSPEHSSASDSGLESGSQSHSDLDSDSDSEGSNFVETISPPRKKIRNSEAKPKARMDLTLQQALPGALPSLMGGYVSGSESEASDVDVAPAMRKNRRGQRARQQIWEKKHGEKAKHFAKAREKANSDRNSGWDARRGAMAGGGGIWKNGKKPFARPGDDVSSAASGGNAIQVKQRDSNKDVKKRDDEGKLHPSWEAKRLAKEKQGNVAFQGKKIVFD